MSEREHAAWTLALLDELVERAEPIVAVAARILRAFLRRQFTQEGWIDDAEHEQR